MNWSGVEEQALDLGNGSGYRAEVRNDQVGTIDVPEPSTLAIFALGLLGLSLGQFRKQ